MHRLLFNHKREFTGETEQFDDITMLCYIYQKNGNSPI